ncbi:sel1 repeat family protein [Solibacillus sp. Sa1YVA6]|uniref:Sel1 repeat family protein n=2 Tax=Caryophanaceae TaxID=186818 RepID=A0ABR8XS67_9BACL|nr:sel1 repeat family protein [Solibacillus merdavium]
MDKRTEFFGWFKQQGLDNIELWLEEFELAEKGMEKAMINVALLYKQYGFFEEMYNLLTTVSEHKNSEAMYELANCYIEGLGGKGSEQQAFSLYKDAANLGHRDAMNNLADMYFNGEATEVDEKKAFLWFEKAAKHGVPEAMYTLGIMYEQGLGTQCNASLALEYYKRSADLQYAEAKYRLGMIFYSGELGQQQNDKEAIEWFRKASEHYHVDAIYNLGYCYEHGHGVIQDVDRAMTYYKQASMLGDREATKRIVIYYEQINLKEAAKWREKLESLESFKGFDEN